eukprot:SAG22_NODE_81_length_21778_cov_38.345173_6_plen_329_part_00
MEGATNRSKRKQKTRGGLLCCGSRTPAAEEKEAAGARGPLPTDAPPNTSAAGQPRQATSQPDSVRPVQKNRALTSAGRKHGAPGVERHRRAVAVKSFEVNRATHEKDLPFVAGQQLVITNCDPAKQWWKGYVADKPPPAGRRGRFPRACVRMLDGTDCDPDGATGAATTAGDAATTVALPASALRAAAIRPFQAAEETDLAFAQGDQLVVTMADPQKQWWTGYLAHSPPPAGGIGVFPKTYVQIISGPHATTAGDGGGGNRSDTVAGAAGVAGVAAAPAPVAMPRSEAGAAALRRFTEQSSGGPPPAGHVDGSSAGGEVETDELDTDF